jgi:hypothetical protein
VLLKQQKDAGMRLDLSQHNFLLLDDFDPSKKFRCAVCFEDAFGLEDIFVLERCRHYLCKGCARFLTCVVPLPHVCPVCSCMSEHVVTLVKSNEATAVRCPMFECKELVDQPQIQVGTFSRRCLCADSPSLSQRIVPLVEYDRRAPFDGVARLSASACRYLQFLLNDNLKNDPTCRWCPKLVR